MSRNIILAVMCLMPARVLASEPPSALELLDKYAQTQAKLGSYVIKGEAVDNRDNKFSGRSKYHSPSYTGKRTKYHSEELRYDGHNIKHIRKAWGDINRRMMNTPESEHSYNSWLWDGHNTYQYGINRLPGKLDSVFLTRGEPANGLKEKEAYQYKLSRGYQGGPAFGYLIGDDERIDIIIRDTPRLRVRPEMEKIGNSNCYVIDAFTKRGRYTVWIDPEHSYNIAQANVVRQPGNGWYKEQLEKNCKKQASIKNVRFEKVDNVWFPFEADIEDYTDFTYGDYGRIDKHYKTTELLISPDHEKLGSFLTDDIANGSQVAIIVPSREYDPRYIWQDGRVLDKDGTVVHTAIAGKMKKRSGK